MSPEGWDAMRILVAEDDPVSRLIVQNLLQKWGHQVDCSEDGKQALSRVHCAAYDVLVSDWMMPEMSGPELCKNIRDLNRTPYCYIILLTALSRTDHLIQGIEAGADDYLTKPVNPDDLKARLVVAQRILGLRSDLASLRALLPICAWCKSIRTDDDLWQSADAYIQAHTKNDLTHSICPPCLEKKLGELVIPDEQ
jgi:sigma-B regulation protein RsbU (phosphoserine phosphatase)